jgi:hypothetical protein
MLNPLRQSGGPHRILICSDFHFAGILLCTGARYVLVCFGRVFPIINIRGGLLELHAGNRVRPVDHGLSVSAERQTVRGKAERGTANRYEARTGAMKFLARDEAGLLEKKLRRQTRNVAFRNSFSMTRVTTTTIPPPRRPLHDRPATFQKQRCCFNGA